ncbi:peptide transporter 3, partial [Prunus dulcis]
IRLRMKKHSIERANWSCRKKGMAAEEGQRVDQYTQDGTVDLKGNPVLRSKRGGWTACSFVVVYEVFERMAYYGISSNLILYLTKKLHQGTVTSANNVTIGLAPFGSLLFWEHMWPMLIWVVTGHFSLLPLSIYRFTSFFETTSLPRSPCRKLQEGLPITSSCVLWCPLHSGHRTGGTKPNISTIGADQFDDFDPKEKNQKLSFFNWWISCLHTRQCGLDLGIWPSTLGLLISVIIFLAGTRFYRHKVPTGSPFTRMAKVIVAAVRKWTVTLPSDPKELHELNLEDYTKKGKFRIDSTPTLRFLNKAAVKTGSNSPWKLCSVTQVEETKQMIRMAPPLIVRSELQNPPASLSGFVTLSMLVSVVLYDRFFVKIMQKLTKNPRGITLLQRMTIGMLFHIIIMVIASLTERYRLNLAKDTWRSRNGGQVPITILILLPQFVLMGTADAFLEFLTSPRSMVTKDGF